MANKRGLTAVVEARSARVEMANRVRMRRMR
jgi:hypothetical protein